MIRPLELFMVFGILLGTCFISYSNGLHNAFMLDDDIVFSDIKLKNIKFLPNAFFYPSAHSDRSEIFNNSDIYYRPMAYVITLFSSLFFGNDPFGYHVLNLFLFTLMCLTVYVFIDLFFKEKFLAFIASLLFAVHPINVFFVDYVTSGIHSIRFICMFMSLIFFLKAGEGFHKHTSYAISLLCFIVALLCHEASMVLPFYIIFAGFYFKKLNLKEAAFISWPYILTLLLYVSFRLYCTSVPSGALRFDANPVIYLATFSRLIFLYITKLFFPQGIVFFWNSALTQGINAFIWAAGLGALLLGLWQLLKSNPRSMASFCTSWFLIGFIPVIWASHSHITDRSYGLILEPQWITFTSVGFFLYAAFIGLKSFAYWKKRAIVIFISLLAILICMTRSCNEIWGDEYNYYFYWSQQITPLPPINYAYLASIYIKKNEYSQAQYYLAKAAKNKPEDFVYNSLGLIDMKFGKMNEAKQEFLLSVKNNPNSSAYNNLGAIYFYQGDYASAKKAFLQTITLDKYCIEARSNLGLISLIQKDYTGAVNYYRENLKILPYEEDSLLGLTQAYTALKDPDDRNKYARLLLAHGQDPATLAALRKFLTAHPD